MYCQQTVELKVVHKILKLNKKDITNIQFKIIK